VITGIASSTATGSADHGIALAGGTTSTTGTGTITLNGTAYGTAAGAATYGVNLSGGAIITAVNGLISVTGTNNSTGTGTGNDGVYVTFAGSTIKSTGTGGVTVLGFGGDLAGVGGADYGVVWDVANGIQSSSTGAINITGTGGDTGGGGGSNNGVYATAALTGGGGAINITGTPSNSTGGGNYGIYLASVAAGSGTLTLTSTGAVTSTGALTAANLNMLGTGGTDVLTNAGNAVTTFAGNTGAMTYSQTGALTIGTVGGTAGLATTGIPWITTGGALTIAAAAAVSGAAPILAATGAFINNDGSGAVTAASGRWLVYSANSTGDTFGSLNSNNAAVWNTPANGAVTATGNRYVFANQPTATVTSVSLGKVYGVDDTAAVAASYTAAGLQSVANAYTDTLATVTTGTASVTSTGSVATATVAGSPYAITAATGTLVSTNGYALAYASPGVLTLTAAAATITATAQTKVYGTANPTLTYTDTGLVNGDVLTGALATTATVTSTVAGSPYAITQGTLTNANYTFTYTGANLTVTVATLTAGLTGTVTKVYNGTTAATLAAGNYTLTGALNGDIITLNNPTAGTYDTIHAGTGKTVTVTGLVISGTNASSYVLASTTTSAAVGTITAATVTAGLTGTVTKVYNGTTAATLAAGNYTLTGVIGADVVTLNNPVAGTYDTLNAGTGKTVSVAGLAISGANSSDYVLAATTASGPVGTITQAALTYVANPASRTYGAANPALSGTTTGFQGSDTQANATTGTLAFTTLAVTGSNVGSYLITGSGLTANNGNYSLNQAAGNATALTITQALATVTGTKVYTATTGFVVGQLAITGGVNGETLSLTAGTGTAASANVGTASGTLSGLTLVVTGGNALASNYQLPTTGALTITQAALTYTANAASRSYGAANPALSGTTTGYQGSDTQANATTGTLSFATLATPSSNVGTYLITGSGLTANNGNYSFVQAAANTTALTITQALATVTGTKVYTATTGFVVGQLAITGGVNGETLSLTAGTGTAASANVGTASGTLAGLTLVVTGGNALASNYQLPTTGNLTITQAALTYVANTATRSYGAANPALSGTTSGYQGTDTQANATTGTLSFATLATASSNVGSYLITGSGLTANNGNYSFVQAAGNATALTITQAAATVTGTKVYTGTTGFVVGQLAITGGVNGETLSLTAGTGTATSANVGTASGTLAGLTLSVAGGNALASNYLLPTTGNLTITQAALIYTANAASRAYGAANPALSGTITGFQGTDTQANATTGTLAFTTLAVTGSNVGSYLITGSGLTANNGNYSFVQAAGNATALTITQAAAAVTGTKVYSGTTGFVTSQLAISGGVNGETLSLTAGTGTAASANVGTASGTLAGLTLVVTGGNALASNYLLPTTGVLTITQAALTITASNQTKTYGGTFTFAGTEFTSTGLQNGQTIGSVTLTSAGSMATASVAGGPYAIVASAATGGTFTAANYTIGYTNGTMTVTQAAATITATAQTKVYGAANPTLTYVVGGSGLLNGDTLTGVLATTASVTSSVAGSPYAITQGTLAASSNYTLAYTGANLTVTAAALTVTASNQSKTYGGTFTFAGTEFTSTGLQNGETIGSVTLISAGSGATASVAGGPYAIVGSAATGGTFTASNYTIGYTNGAMTVTAAALTVTANPQTRAYGATNPTLTYVVGGSGLLNGDTLTGVLATTASVTSSVAGSPYAITQGTLAASSNYTLAYTGVNLTVTAAALTVTANNQSKTYGGTFTFAGTEFTSVGLQNGETIGSVTLTSAGSVATASVAGSPYAIVASAATGGTFTASNYTIGYTNGAMTVTAAALTVTANAQTRAYGAANPTLTYVVGGSGLLNGDTLTGVLATTASVTSSVAGSPYAITQGTLAASSNYTLAYTGANLTVTAAALTVAAGNQSKTYGGTFTFAGTEFTFVGLQNGQTIGSVTLTSAGSVATASVAGGPYAIVASAATGGTFAAANYTIGYTNGAMTVTAAALTVTANAQTRAYGAANPTLTYVVGGSGLLNVDTLTGLLATTAGVASNVGAYAITQGTLAASSNYTLAYTGANLTVTAAALTVTASNQSKTYGGTFTFAGTEFTSSGLQNGETIGSVTLTSAGSVATASVAGSPYAIVASAATGGTFTAANYTIGYTNGALTVTAAALTVTANVQSRAYGANPALTYTTTGLVNGDTLSGALATPATVISNIGTYAITQGGFYAALSKGGVG